MDTKIIKQYGEDILCYRLRTARQKKRMQYKDLEKQLIQLGKEQKILYQQRRNLGWEPLTPAVQKGWKRFFVLREDVARSYQGEFFENILNKINTYDWSHRKDFRIRKRRFGRKKYEIKEQRLIEPNAEEFKKLDLNEKEKNLFHEEWRYDFAGSIRRYFVFNEPWRFQLRVRPNMITKVRERNETTETRIKAIDNYLVKNDLEWTQLKLTRGSCKWRHRDFEKYNEADPFKDWPLKRILDNIKEESSKE